MGVDVYFTIVFLGKRYVINSSDQTAAFRRLPKNTFRRRVFIFFLRLVFLCKNFFLKPVCADSVELFSGYSIKSLLGDVTDRLNYDFTVVLVVWAGDSIRNRRYIWLRDEYGAVYFVKLGLGEANLKVFKVESKCSELFSEHCSGNSLIPVVSKYYTSSNNLTFTISECVIDSGAVSMYVPWKILEPEFKEFRTRTKKRCTFFPDEIDWIRLNSSGVLCNIFSEINRFSGCEYETCLSHGDLGSENVLVGESIYLIDFECTLMDAPILLDPVANYLDSRNPLQNVDVWAEFSNSPDLDVLLAVCYLSINNFPPAIAALNMRKS